MTEEMRKVAAARILDDRVEIHEKSTVWVGLKLAVIDIKLYVFLFMNIFITSSYGFNNFFPTIVSGLGMIHFRTTSFHKNLHGFGNGNYSSCRDTFATYFNM